MSIYSGLKNKLLILKKYRQNRIRKKLNALDKNLIISGEIVVKYAPKIEIGCNCRLNEYVFLHGGGGIRIDDDVTISAFAKIISYGYDTTNWENNFITKNHIGGKIHIGRGAWIGAGAIVLPGVKITGQGVIVAAGSVVTKDFHDDFILIGGTPARILKKYKK